MKRIVWSLLFLLAAVLITLRSLALAQDCRDEHRQSSVHFCPPVLRKRNVAPFDRQTWPGGFSQELEDRSGR